MRAAIMGAGSLGTVLGAYIAKAGKQIDLIDAYKDHVDALNNEGAHVTGTFDFTVPVHALMPEEMEGEYDLIIYMAKQTYNDTAIPQIKAHLAEKARSMSTFWQRRNIWNAWVKSWFLRI